MSYIVCGKFTRIFLVLCFLLTVKQVLGKAIDLEDEEDDDQIFKNVNKPQKRKSARMAFMEDTDDPMFKFLTKILNTAQQRSKNRLARAQNGIKETQQLKTEVANKLRKNNLPLQNF